MENLITYTSSRKQEYLGKSKDLDKLLNKIKSTVSAPINEKGTKRMQVFSQNRDLVNFINDTLRLYFESKNSFEINVLKSVKYDIITTWYFFTLLVYSSQVEDSVTHMISKMMKSKHSDLSIARRILNLCKNPIYQQELDEVEAFFAKHNITTKVYKWMTSLDVRPPQVYNWELIFCLGTIPKTITNPEFPNDLYLTVKASEPRGNGESYRIEISDKGRMISSRWDDFSTNKYLRLGKEEIVLSSVPELRNLKEFIAELEQKFDLEFEMNYRFQYFTRGFKNKTNIRKWLLEN